MSVKGRNFCCDDQKVLDILRAIEVIQPVVYLIRELEKTEQSLKLLREKKKKIESDISSLETTMTLYKENYGKDSANLGNLFYFLNDKKEKLISEEKILCSTFEELSDLIWYEYLEYADSFIWIEEDIAQEVIGLNDPKWPIEKFLAIFLILFNKGLDKEKRKRIFEVLSLNWQESLHEEMQILKQTEGDQDKIVLYIRNH